MPALMIYSRRLPDVFDLSVVGAQHLARHNLKVDFKRIVANDQDIGNTILSAAADLGSDMIIMGGYGH